jgi:hypothetical protein
MINKTALCNIFYFPPDVLVAGTLPSIQLIKSIKKKPALGGLFRFSSDFCYFLCSRLNDDFTRWQQIQPVFTVEDHRE